MRNHGKNKMHLKCMALCNRSSTAVALQKASRAALHGLVITSDDEVLLRQVTTVYQVAKLNLPPFIGPRDPRPEEP